MSSCALLAFTPAATATDFFTITGSGTKTVRITRVEISGYATAAANIPIQLIRRSTANTSGTSGATSISQHDPNDSAATATPLSYSANPTLGTTAYPLRAAQLNLGAPGAAGTIVWDFTTRNTKGIVTDAEAPSWSSGGAAEERRDTSASPLKASHGNEYVWQSRGVRRNSSLMRWQVRTLECSAYEQKSFSQSDV